MSLNVRSHSITPISSYQVQREKTLGGDRLQSFVDSLTPYSCGGQLPSLFLSPVEGVGDELCFFLNLPLILIHLLFSAESNSSNRFF